MRCTICGATQGTNHTFQEKMFATNAPFPYWECGECGCMQIIEIPANLGDYYAAGYYTHSMGLSRAEHYACKAYALVPHLASMLRRPGPSTRSVLAVKPKRGARILDVGCGGGRSVMVLRAMGYDAHGIDPFLSERTAYVRNATLEDTETGWDLITFHHSLEHMQNHIEVLRMVRERLAHGGTCIVRIPVVNWAWKHFGANWAQIDAPRHLILHTPRSFERTAKLAGFKVRTTFDSDAFQYYASEMCEQNIPFSEGPAEIRRRGKRAMRELNAQAAKLNQEGLGDSGCFFLS
jgi:SAM-dependent methyltransferase